MGDQPYQLLPPLSGEEYTALRADIAEHGIRVPVDVDESGTVLDGHHRAQIAAELGIPLPTRTVVGLDEEAKRDHALVVNVQRRILTREHRRSLIAQAIERRPEDSDREIGRLLGCDHKTVGAVRRELRGEIPHHRLARVLEEQDYSPYTVHPFLAKFPLVPPAQFGEIAQSIRRSGLFMPITLNHDRTMIVDGRIRYLACRVVHVEPHYRVLGPEYGDQEFRSYIMGANVIRQSFTEGQIAAAMAKLEELRAQLEPPPPGPAGGGTDAA